MDLVPTFKVPILSLTGVLPPSPMALIYRCNYHESSLSTIIRKHSCKYINAVYSLKKDGQKYERGKPMDNDDCFSIQSHP